MGNQGMAFEGNRLINEWLADGAIGPVREVHVWSDRPTHSGKLPLYWAQGIERPKDQPPVPATAGLGPVARPGPVAAVPSGLRAVPLARLVGFRLRRPGRHGHPQPRPGVLGAATDRARPRVDASSTAVYPETLPLASCVHYEFPGPRRYAAGRCTGMTAAWCPHGRRNWKRAGN